MKSLFSCCITFLCFVSISIGQTDQAILFTIGDQEYSVEGFVRSYQKNSELISSDSESLETHLERYINFQLKLKSAYDEQLDTLPSFRKEFNRYYKQIADNYISNGDVTEAMVKETYDRTKTEVRASHILLNVPQYEQDTTAIYQKALMVKQRLIDGEDFESLARTYSEDPSAKQNGGDLNWFNTFKMVYEFEEAAYALDVGEVSDPVRTSYGYHIIKKTGERPSKGKLKTAHIMLLPSDSLEDPELRIHKIYDRLKQGEDFHVLAKTYSQDPNSASNGGYLTPFGIGGLNSKIYENESYKLDEVGDYTQPFKTRFGWHIVKLIEIIPLESYEEIKEDLKRRLKASSRSKILVKNIKKSLEKLYDVEVNQKAKNYFLNLTDDSFSQGKWRYQPEDSLSEKAIFTIDEKKISYNVFGEFLEKKQRKLTKLPDHKIVLENALDDLIYRELLSYHKSKLPTIDKEFGNKIKEYKDGILIFDYMTAKVWETVSQDSVSQKKYFKKYREEFTTPEMIEGELFTSKSKKSLKNFRSSLKRLAENDTMPQQIPQDIILEKVSLENKSSKLPKNFSPKQGLSKIYKHSGQFLFMNVSKIKPEKALSFEEVRGKIISKLQDNKETQLVVALREQYDVNVNEDVFQKLKQQFE